MKRMRLAALFAAVLLLAAAPVRAAQMEYGEPVLSAWATDSYYKANEYSILNWFCRSGDFTAPITRAEFCDMLFNAVQAISYGAAAQIDLGGPEPFSDTDRDSVYCLAQLGIAQGVGGGRFAPEGTLTRQQAAVFLSRAAARLDFSCLPEERAAFTDADSIAPWAAAAAEEMQQAGLMAGTDTGAFLPQALLTREQAAAVLVRFVEKSGFNFGMYLPGDRTIRTESDLAAMHGKYRPTDGGYTIEYYQPGFASLVVTVTGGALRSAVYTDLGSGARGDLTRQSLDAVYRGVPLSGRLYLGGGMWSVEEDGVCALEQNGKTLLTLDEGYAYPRCQRLRGAWVAYAVSGGKTTFFSTPDGAPLFTVDGYVHRLTNRYIITEAVRYAGETVDAAYSVYGVYTLDGAQVAPLGLSDWALYEQGYVTDD